MRLKISTLLLIAVTWACSPSPATSSGKAIGTDLPDDGSEQTDVYLYWVRNATIYRGECPDRHNILRLTCTDNLKAMSYLDFKQTLDGGLSDTIRTLTAESRRIQVAMSRIQTQIDAVLAAISDLEDDQGNLSHDLRQLRAKLSWFRQILDEYRYQLSLIDAALRDIEDEEIERQRLVVIARITEYQTRVTSIDNDMRDIIGQIQAIDQQIGQLQTRLVALSTRMSNLSYELQDVETRLAKAHSDFSVYQDTLYRLNDGIIFTVLSDNVSLRQERMFIRRFDHIFANI